MDESHDDFMDRVRKMSSAGYRPLGFENFRHSQASSFSTANGLASRRAQKNDVLVLLAQGKRDAEIADELGIAEDTVRTLRISRM